MRELGSQSENSEVLSTTGETINFKYMIKSEGT